MPGWGGRNRAPGDLRTTSRSLGAGAARETIPGAMRDRTQAFRVTGMDCAEEVALLKRELGGLVGGEDRLGFDLVAGKLTVPGGADADAVRRRIDATGMTLSAFSRRLQHANPVDFATAVSGRSRTW